MQFQYIISMFKMKSEKKKLNKKLQENNKRVYSEFIRIFNFLILTVEVHGPTRDLGKKSQQLKIFSYIYFSKI